jgi:hypothetical protein
VQADATAKASAEVRRVSPAVGSSATCMMHGHSYCAWPAWYARNSPCICRNPDIIIIIIIIIIMLQGPLQTQ